MTVSAAYIEETRRQLEQHEAEINARRLAAAEAAQDRDHVEAAQALGISTAEVAKVKTTRGVVAVTTTDGIEYLILPLDKPDAEGKVGVMFRHPHGARNSFPVFAPYSARPVLATPDVEAVPEPVPDPDADDPVISGLEQELAEAESAIAEIDAGGWPGPMNRHVPGQRHPSERAWLEQRIGAVKSLLGSRRARRQAARDEANPPPPDADDVSFKLAVYRWASAVLGASDDRTVRQLDAEHKARDPRLGGVRPARTAAGQPSYRELFSVAMAPAELAGVTQWLDHHGIPLPDEGA